MSDNKKTKPTSLPVQVTAAGPSRASDTKETVSPAKISGKVLMKILGEPENDFCKAFSSAIEESCKKLFESTGSNVKLAKNWNIALEQLLKNRQDDYEEDEEDEGVESWSEVIQDICSQILDQEFKKLYTTDPDTIWKGATEEYLRDHQFLEREGQSFEELQLNQNIYKKLSWHIEHRCKEILASGQWKILHQVSSRAKTYDSLSKKAGKLADELSKKLFDHSSPIDINFAKGQLAGNIRDLAGIRVLAYFPDDVLTVLQAIQDAPDLHILGNPYISFTKNRIDHRAKDMELQRSGAAAVDYSLGVFVTKPVPLEEVAQRWKHYGYRGLHVHVQLKERPAEGDHIMSDDKVVAEAKTALSKSKSTLQRDVDQIRSARPLHITDGKGISPELIGKIAEIQISTVVMHAWSQVEHDIIYKNPYRVPINDTMTRMLDALNGSSINSEIMLEELRRTMVELRRVIDSTYFPFDSEEAAYFLYEEYLKETDDWDIDPRWVWAIALVSKQRYEYPRDYISTPADLRKFVTEKGILESHPSEGKKLDIGVAILKALSIQFRADFLEECQKPSSKYPEWTNTSTFLYKCLLAGNAFCIMVAIGGLMAIDQFKQKFEDGPYKLGLINSIILCIKRPEASSEMERELEHFADEFLGSDQFEAHSIAVALANLWFFADIAEKGTSVQNPSYVDLVSHYGEFQSVVFQPIRNSGRGDLQSQESFNLSDYIPFPWKHDIDLTFISPGEGSPLSIDYTPDEGFKDYRIFRVNGKDSIETKSNIKLLLRRFHELEMLVYLSNMDASWTWNCCPPDELAESSAA